MKMRLIQGGVEHSRPDSADEEVVLKPYDVLPRAVEEQPYVPRKPRFEEGVLTMRDRLLAIFVQQRYGQWAGVPPLVVSGGWKLFDIQSILRAAEFVPFLHSSFREDLTGGLAQAYADLDFVTPPKYELQVPSRSRAFGNPAVSIERVEDDRLKLTFGHMMRRMGEWRITNWDALMGDAGNTIVPAPVTYFKEEK